MNEQQGELARVRLLEVDPELAGQRLDNFLASRMKGVPKSRIYNLIRKGEVRVNKGRSKPDYKLASGDWVRIPPVRMSAEPDVPMVGQALTDRLEKSILLETEGLLVVNKPPGLAVHGGSGVSLGLIEALRQIRPEIKFLELVHRLDKDTSGCIMVAKKRSVLKHLQEALRDKSAGAANGVRKVYHALVLGEWPSSIKRINAPLLKLETGNGERIVKVNGDGKPSVTEFVILKCYEGYTLVEARPITGRTHQIRVHAQHLGHSLAGDEKYGSDEANKVLRGLGVKRLFLHAAELEFTLPGETESRRVTAPLPMDLAQPLARLKSL